LNAATRASNLPGDRADEPRLDGLGQNRDGIAGNHDGQAEHGVGASSGTSDGSGTAADEPAADLIASLSGHEENKCNEKQITKKE